MKLCSAFGVLDRTGRSSEPEIVALLSFHNTHPPRAEGRVDACCCVLFCWLFPPPCSEVYTLHELRIEWSHSRCRRLRDASAVREMPADALARQAAAREAKRRREEASTQRRASWRTRSRACLPRGARLGAERVGST